MKGEGFTKNLCLQGGDYPSRANSRIYVTIVLNLRVAFFPEKHASPPSSYEIASSLQRSFQIKQDVSALFSCKNLVLPPPVQAPDLSALGITFLGFADCNSNPPSPHLCRLLIRQYCGFYMLFGNHISHRFPPLC